MLVDVLAALTVKSFSAKNKSSLLAGLVLIRSSLGAIP